MNPFIYLSVLSMVVAAAGPLSAFASIRVSFNCRSFEPSRRVLAPGSAFGARAGARERDAQEELQRIDASGRFPGLVAIEEVAETGLTRFRVDTAWHRGASPSYFAFTESLPALEAAARQIRLHNDRPARVPSTRDIGESAAGFPYLRGYPVKITLVADAKVEADQVDLFVSRFEDLPREIRQRIARENGWDARAVEHRGKFFLVEEMIEYLMLDDASRARETLRYVEIQGPMKIGSRASRERKRGVEPSPGAYRDYGLTVKPGISGNHLDLEVKDGVLTLSDPGSSFGSEAAYLFGYDALLELIRSNREVPEIRLEILWTAHENPRYLIHLTGEDQVLANDPEEALRYAHAVRERLHPESVQETASSKQGRDSGLLSPRDFRVGRNSSGRFFYLEGYPFAFAIASESGTNPVSFTVFGSGDLPAAVWKRPEFEKTEKNPPFFITRDPADPESYRPFSASFTVGIENRRGEAEGSVTLRRFGNRIVVLNRSLHRVSVRYPERSRRADRALAVLEEIASMEVRPGEKRYPGLLVPWTDGTLRFNPGWRRDRSGDDGLVFMDPVTDPVHTLEIVRSLVPEGVAAAVESVGLDPVERLQFAAYLKLLHAFTENEPLDAIRRLAPEINRVFGLTSDSLNVLTKKVSAYLRKTQMGRRSPGAPDIEGAHVLLLHFLSLESVNGIAFDEDKMNFRRLMKASPRLDGAIDRVARQLYASA